MVPERVLERVPARVLERVPEIVGYRTESWRYEGTGESTGQSTEGSPPALRSHTALLLSINKNPEKRLARTARSPQEMTQTPRDYVA